MKCGENRNRQPTNEISKVAAIDMKSPLITFLLAASGLSAVLSVIFCVLYVSSTRELRLLQGQMTFINGRINSVTALANEAFEYSKRNAAIDPILESIGMKSAKTSPATNKPPAK
jgi:hypothetical protein